jgi:hypothetical protein
LKILCEQIRPEVGESHSHAYFCPLAQSKKHHMKRNLLSGILILTGAIANAQNCSDIFISEYVEGSNNNKAIELYNPTANPIVLDGHYSMGRDRDGAGVPMLIAITGTIAPYDVRVFALDKRDPNGTGQEVPLFDELEAAADTFLNPVYVQTDSPMYFNGDDAFVLVKDGINILDIVGRIGEDPGNGWWAIGDPFTAWWTVDNTMIRKQGIQQGVTSNPDVFDPAQQWDSLPNNTFSQLGTHLCSCSPINVTEIQQHEFSMFPNPIADGQFAIKASHEMSAYSIYTADGRLIEQKKLMSGRFASITLPQSEAGIYYIEIEYVDGSRKSEKLISR